MTLDRSSHESAAAAHDAPLREALESVRWERRGLLQRLTRQPLAETGCAPSAHPARHSEASTGSPPPFAPPASSTAEA
jgi:hypothetical protein